MKRAKTFFLQEHTQSCKICGNNSKVYVYYYVWIIFLIPKFSKFAGYLFYFLSYLCLIFININLNGHLSNKTYIIFLEIGLVLQALMFLPVFLQNSGHQPRGGTIHHQLSPPPSIINYQNNLQECVQTDLMETFSPVRFPPFSCHQLCQVEIKPASTSLLSPLPDPPNLTFHLQEACVL